MYQIVKKNRCLLAGSIIAASVNSIAADIEFKGFASFFGGVVVDSVELPSGEDTTYVADLGFSNAGINEKAEYSDSISFLPDSNYGLQIKSDLGSGLTILTQLAGRGSQDFAAEFEWAYLSYELTSNLNLQAGRQRTPLYFYSDFLDVGYAYHWVRPPEDVYSNFFPTYDGASLSYAGSLGDWSSKFRVFTGQTENDTSQVGIFGSDALYGLTFEVENDYLRAFASTLTGDFYTSNPETPVSITFSSLSAQFTYGQMFLISEMEQISVPDGEFLGAEGSPIDFSSRSAFMASIGIELGDFTPHLTVLQSETELFGSAVPEFAGESIKRQAFTAGVRWDFHPSSAFKIELTAASDESTEVLVQTLGKTEEASAVVMGFDIVF